MLTLNVTMWFLVSNRIKASGLECAEILPRMLLSSDSVVKNVIDHIVRIVLFVNFSF